MKSEQKVVSIFLHNKKFQVVLLVWKVIEGGFTISWGTCYSSFNLNIKREMEGKEKLLHYFIRIWRFYFLWFHTYVVS